MENNQSSDRPRRDTLRTVYLSLLVITTGILILAAMLVPLTLEGETIALSLGEAAPQDILAPRDINFESDVLTLRAQDIAAENTDLVYAPPDVSIARSQVAKLRDTLNFIEVVRADDFANFEEKSADLSALQHINLSQDQIQQILDMRESNWQVVEQETISVLEQVMRSTIREDRLEEARDSIPTLVSFALSDNQATLVSELVAAFTSPNSLYSQSLTEEQREEARQNVTHINVNYIANETVIARGEVVTTETLEAMEALGILQTSLTWQEIASLVALVLVCVIFMTLYMRYRVEVGYNPRSLFIVAALFVLFLVGVRFLTPNRTLVPYMFPLAGYSLLVSVLISPPSGRMLALPLGILAGYGLVNSLELTLYYVITCMFGVLVLKNAQRITNFFWAGLGIAGSGSAIILTYRLTDPNTDLVGILQLLGAALVYAFSSIALTVVMQFFLAPILNLTTTLQLTEISRPDHKLLQFIMRNAPGTYQHSLQIANLAEQAAELIEADALLTRVGSLYHDAGKALFPHYFIENQVEGAPNPHEFLTPLESSKIIIKHVIDGIELAEKYRLPQRVKDFILEHHGTLITQFQFTTAINEASGDSALVDKEDFRYPGPQPQSRETALVMLADGCEARARAEKPDSRDGLHHIVKDTVEGRLAAGQLDETDLTMRDIKLIIESYTNTLRGIYHPRILYPEDHNAPTRPSESRQQPA